MHAPTWLNGVEWFWRCTSNMRTSVKMMQIQHCQLAWQLGISTSSLDSQVKEVVDVLPPGVRDRTQKRSKAEKKKAKVPAAPPLSLKVNFHKPSQLEGKAQTRLRINNEWMIWYDSDVVGLLKWKSEGVNLDRSCLGGVVFRFQLASFGRLVKRRSLAPRCRVCEQRCSRWLSANNVWKRREVSRFPQSGPCTPLTHSWNSCNQASVSICQTRPPVASNPIGAGTCNIWMWRSGKNREKRQEKPQRRSCERRCNGWQRNGKKNRSRYQSQAPEVVQEHHL